MIIIRLNAIAISVSAIIILIVKLCTCSTYHSIDVKKVYTIANDTVSINNPNISFIHLQGLYRSKSTPKVLFHFWNL